MNEIPDIKCQNDPARVPSVRVRLGTTCLLTTLEIHGFARFEYSIIRNFQYSKCELKKKDQNTQIHVMNVQFHFSGVVQLGLSPILSDEVLRFVTFSAVSLFLLRLRNKC